MEVEEYITIKDAAILSGKTELAIRSAITRGSLKQYEPLGAKALKRNEFDAWRNSERRGRPKSASIA